MAAHLHSTRAMTLHILLMRRFQPDISTGVFSFFLTVPWSLLQTVEAQDTTIVQMPPSYTEL